MTQTILSIIVGMVLVIVPNTYYDGPCGGIPHNRTATGWS